MRAPLRRSLSLRLLAIFVVTDAATLAVLVLLLREGLSAQWRRAIQPHLARYVEYALDDLGDPPSLERARDIAAAVPVEIALYDGPRFVGATDDRPLPLDRLRFRRPGPPGRGELDLRLPDAPARLVGDEARLRVLVRNLVENATLHGRGADGVARVGVALAGGARGDGWTLAVSDAGPGVPAERRDAVVEAFERLDASRSRRTGGVGLGLALARRIAEAHGGAPSLGDARAGGLVVTVRLPSDPAARGARNVRS